MNERIGFRMFSNDSICFHVEALGNNPMQKVALSLHDRIDVTIIFVSHFSLVSYTTSPSVGTGIKLCNQVQETATEFCGCGISFTNDVS